MSSVACEDIYGKFLGYIKDNRLLTKNYETVETFMFEWLQKSYSKPYVRRLFSSLSYDEEEDVLNFELNYSVDEDSDVLFVTDVLCLGMVAAWLSPIVRSRSNLVQFFGGKEQNFYSQASHLDQLRGVLEDVKLEQRNLIRDRGYVFNSYLEGAT